MTEDASISELLGAASRPHGYPLAFESVAYTSLGFLGQELGDVLARALAYLERSPSLTSPKTTSHTIVSSVSLGLNALSQ